jgi:hypothetical protein
MTGIVCADHPDRAALAYCSGCGRTLCSQCLVRLTAGNYCPSCADTPDHRPARPAGRSRRLLWIGLAALAIGGYIVTRML